MTTAHANGGAAGADERAVQKEYWKEHSGEATVEAMMLDSKAADIDKLERPEVRRELGMSKFAWCGCAG